MTTFDPTNNHLKYNHLKPNAETPAGRQQSPTAGVETNTRLIQLVSSFCMLKMYRRASTSCHECFPVLQTEVPGEEKRRKCLCVCVRDAILKESAATAGVDTANLHQTGSLSTEVALKNKTCITSPNAGHVTDIGKGRSGSPTNSHADSQSLCSAELASCWDTSH